MKSFILPAAVLLLTGCPDQQSDPDAPSWDSPAKACVEEYTEAMLDEHYANDDNFSEFCDNALDSMSSDGNEEWVERHDAVWEAEGSIPSCRGNDGTSEIHRTNLLRDREVMRVRCKALGPQDERCDGHDPEACNWD